MAVDYKPVAAAALEMAITLLPQWIGGHREGHEWLAERKANGGPGDSLKVNLNNGVWANFSASPGDHNSTGHDLIGLYAHVYHLDQGAAGVRVAEAVGITDRAVELLPRRRPPEPVAQPIPQGTPDPLPHHIHGAASAVYRYGTAFAVGRYDTAPGVKVFAQYTWRDGKWRGKGPTGQLPLYHVEDLAKYPERPVLVVEGEKCADAARTMLVRQIIVTWAGGANAVRKTDWRSLADRDVTIWPDADEPGHKAAAAIGRILLPIARRVRILRPNGHADGWDVADAISEGWSADGILTWADDHVTEVEAPSVEVLPPADPESNYPAGSAPQSSLALWQNLRLDCDNKQIPHATLSNASTILQLHPHFQGKLWLDSFRGKVYHTLRGAPRLWTDADSRSATAWIQQQVQLPKINLALVQDAVMHAAECQQRNSLTAWLDSLEWDQVPRLDTWLADCLGTDRSPYNDAVARNWPISMAARAYQPGCQVDTMPVLEGRMGRGKSRFLDVLASPWFAAIQIAFGDKDFFQAIQGRWLIEIPDMSGFSRREHTHILATITTRVDVYRKSHGRITEEYPRVTVFAATSENDEYLQESRGRRRYWPLVCGDINLETLHQQREQIFAEAVAEYRNGASWHIMPKGTDAEQAARASRDIWTDRVIQYVDSYGDNKLTSAAILENACQVKVDKLDETAKRRIYRIMMENGWKQLHGRTERYWKKIATDA